MKLSASKAAIGLALIWASFAQASSSPLEPARQSLEQKNYQQMAGLLEPAQRQYRNDAEFWYLFGRASFGLDDMAAAEKHLKKAAELASDDADYQFWYGQSSCNRAQSVNMLRARGFAMRCRDAFQAAAELEPETLKYQRALGQFLTQAPSIAGGDTDKALDVARQVKTFDELQGQLLELDVYAAKQDLPAFEQLLASSDALQKRPGPYVTLGFYFQREGDHRQAITKFEHATRLEIATDDEAAQQQSLMAWYQIGRSALLGKIEIDQGIAALQHYRQQDDSNEWADLRLAQLYLLQDQQEQARHLISALQANSQDQNLQDEINKLRL